MIAQFIAIYITFNILQQLFKLIYVVNDPEGFLNVQDKFQPNTLKS